MTTMTAAPPWQKLWGREVLGEIAMLTGDQTKAYLKLQIYMWEMGGALPNDDERLALLVGATRRQWEKLKASIIGLFEVADDVITHHRVTADRAAVGEASAKQAAKARARWRKNGSKKSTQESAEFSANPLNNNDPDSAAAYAGAYAESRGKSEEDSVRAGDSEIHTGESTRGTSSAGDEKSPSEGEVDEEAPGNRNPARRKFQEYAFEARFIRLSRADFERWEQNFSNINLRAELEALDGWAATIGKGWFTVLQKALAKKDRKALEQRQAADRAASVAEKIAAIGINRMGDGTILPPGKWCGSLDENPFVTEDNPWGTVDKTRTGRPIGWVRDPYYSVPSAQLKARAARWPICPDWVNPPL